MDHNRARPCLVMYETRHTSQFEPNRNNSLAIDLFEIINIMLYRCRFPDPYIRGSTDYMHASWACDQTLVAAQLCWRYRCSYDITSCCAGFNVDVWLRRSLNPCDCVLQWLPLPHCSTCWSECWNLDRIGIHPFTSLSLHVKLRRHQHA